MKAPKTRKRTSIPVPHLLTAVLGALTVAAIPSNERGNKPAPAGLDTVAAARFLLCPRAFDEASLVAYLETSSPERYREYIGSSEFNPAKRQELLQAVRAEERARAQKKYVIGRECTLSEVEMLVGGYDSEQQGFWISAPDSTSLYVTGRFITHWPAPYSSTRVPQTAVQVMFEYPRQRTIFDGRKGGFSSCPWLRATLRSSHIIMQTPSRGFRQNLSVDPLAPPWPHVANVTDTGARKIFA
jgi:hypothetical protein